MKIIDFLLKLKTNKSASELKRLCKQGAVAFYDPLGWGVFPDDRVVVNDPFMELHDLYGNPPPPPGSLGETPNKVKIGKRLMIEVNTGYNLTKVVEDKNSTTYKMVKT